jgi:hypothetical protein
LYKRFGYRIEYAPNIRKEYLPAGSKPIRVNKRPFNCCLGMSFSRISPVSSLPSVSPQYVCVCGSKFERLEGKVVRGRRGRERYSTGSQRRGLLFLDRGLLRWSAKGLKLEGPNLKVKLISKLKLKCLKGVPEGRVPEGCSSGLQRVFSLAKEQF